MSFTLLPFEIKIKIFNTLSLWDRYNASLVWEEMSYETWRSIPTIEEFISKLTGQNDTTLRIKSADDLEKAAILASAGHLHSIEKLALQEIDIENVPIKLVNCLAKVVKDQLRLWKVTGLWFSMLENIGCKKLIFKNMTIPEQFSTNINISGSVSLSFISGFVNGLLDSITCDSIKIEYSKDTSLDGDKAMVEMLQRRVRELEFWDVKPFNYSLLENYDGQGHCERMKFTDTQFGINTTKENLLPWSESNGWKVTIDDRINFEIKRSTTSLTPNFMCI